MDEILPVAVVEAVAEAKDCEPTNLDFTLEDYIPTDALKQLAAHQEGSWTLSFKLPNHNVTVTSNGPILVDGSREHVWTCR